MISVTLLKLLAPAAVLALTASGCSLVGAGDRYDATLVRYDNDKGETNRYINLDDGKAQLSIGSPDGHRMVVQWRDPDGAGWTKPETVWTDEKNVAVDNTVRYGGGTVGILQTYTTDIHSDTDADSLTIGIVCRELECAAEEVPNFGQPQVAPDGESVYLGQSEEGAALWSADDGIRLAPWSGHPNLENRDAVSSIPVLAPDGSLRVVSSRPSSRACTFDLFTSNPATADLHRVARARKPIRGRSRSDCASYLDSFSADWLTVHPNGHRAETFWFVRSGDDWATTSEDPSGLRVVDVDHGCCSSSQAAFIHWNDVSYGSPDGRRIQVQTHLLGEEQWSEPQILDGAPTGYTCTWLEGAEVGTRGFAILMTCHSGKVRNDFDGDAYAVAASPDLATWESTFVSGVARAPRVDEDSVKVGNLTWTTEDGFITK